MPPRILILDNAVHRFLFHPTGPWRRLLDAVAYDRVNVPSGQEIPPLDRYTHLLLSGSEASICSPKPWFEVEAATIRTAVDRGLPVLGSCFGHQMLVYALSGAESLCASAAPEVGWIEVEALEADELLTDLPERWHTFAYHFDEVSAPPPAPWRTLARSERCPTQIIRYGELPVWGVQPHPEVTVAKARFFLALFRAFAGTERRRLISRIDCTHGGGRIAEVIVARFLEAGEAHGGR